MDELKKYLLQNADALDTDAPPSHIWQQVKAQTVKVPAKVAGIKTILKYAAAACVAAAIAGGAVYISMQQQQVDEKLVTIGKLPHFNARSVHKQNITEPLKQQNTDLAVVKPPHKTAPVITPDTRKKRKTAPSVQPADDLVVQHLRNNYAQLTSMQLDRLRNTPLYAEDPSYFNSFKTQLQQMDADEKLIRKDIRSNGLDDNMLEQLINVYQRKLQILKDLQTEITRMNNRVKQRQLPTDSAKISYLKI